jgi:hypothetical protein
VTQNSIEEYRSEIRCIKDFNAFKRKRIKQEISLAYKKEQEPDVVQKKEVDFDENNA